ncbi:MAG TPA: ECF transporter S component [Clostridia bacterium]|nr:ECF transporter S component [Clostridia bacterium]
MNRTHETVYASLLTALALVIPLAFGGVLGVYLPPFSATLGSHVPLMLAMLISPYTAVIVGVGSALGFLIKLGPAIAARALMHSAVGFVGAVAYRKGFSYWQALLIALPVHAVLEALIVLPFGFTLYNAGVVVGVGTALHHVVDAGISVLVFEALRRVGILRGAAAEARSR